MVKTIAMGMFTKHSTMVSSKVFRSLCRTRKTLTTTAKNTSSIREFFRSLPQPRHSPSITLMKGYAPGIHLIKIHNPSKRNAISPAMMVDLAEIVDSLDDTFNSTQDIDTDSAGLILTGSETTFCSGFDLSSVENQPDLVREVGPRMSQLMHHSLTKLANLPLISVAAIQGHAVGGGAELSTATDFRSMSNGSASVRFVQVDMGVSTGWGGATRLKSIVGRKEALKILGMGKRLSVSECEQIGLVDCVVDTTATKGDDSNHILLQGTVDYLNHFIYDREGRKRPAHVLRGIKRVLSDVAKHQDESLFLERHVFETFWGGKANLDAIDRWKK